MDILSISKSLFAIVLLAPVALAQNVLVVDPSGANGAFLVPQTAVDAAADGDLILIKSGDYQSVAIVGKGLTMAADSGALVIFENRISVKNLPASSQVVLDGFDLIAVAVVDTLLDSGPGLVSFPSGTALTATDSNIYVYGSTLLGAGGRPTTFFPGLVLAQPGAPALSLEGGSALVVDSLLTGGHGGLGTQLTASTWDGRAALLMNSGQANPSLVVYGSTLTGGAGGGATSPALPGTPGLPIDVQASTVTTPNAFVRSLEVDSVVRDGEVSTLQFTGQPFDLVFHIIGLATDNNIAFSPLLFGAIHPGGSPLFIKFRGLLNAAGTNLLGGEPREACPKQAEA